MTEHELYDASVHTVPRDRGTHERDWKRALEDGLPRLRHERRWTQQDLAEACGLHRETISRWERPGSTNSHPTNHTLRALALAFNHDDIVDFWTALCGAAAIEQGGSWLRLTTHQHQLVANFTVLTEVQQELVELLMLLFRTRLHGNVRGDRALDDVEALLALAKQRPHQ
jgi:transcriptional regulator with XRE-family HTH domain